MKMDSNTVQLKEEGMANRENELVLKMSRRMSQLEEQLNDVQKRLIDAVNAIAEKDKIIDSLKAQIIEEGIQKLNKNYNDPNVENPLITSENSTEIMKDYKKRKPRPIAQVKEYIHPSTKLKDYSREFGINSVQKSGNTSDINVSETKKYSPKSEMSDKIKEAKKITDAIEERMMKSKRPPNLALSKAGPNSGDSLEYVKDNISSYSSIEEDADIVSEEMEEEYNRLAKQVSEMEKFLEDYGLIWVGDADIKDGDSYKKVQASIGFSPNFDKIIMVISELNDIVSSESQVDVTEKKGKFKKAEVLKLTLFSDGIQLEDNPFREYSSPSVQEFFHDLEDGYYPTELKDTYPDGVIFKVVDKRSKTYEDFKKKRIEPFSGKGHKLGSAETQKGPRGPTEQEVQPLLFPGTVEGLFNSEKRGIPPYPGPSGRKEKEKQAIEANVAKEETLGDKEKRVKEIPLKTNIQDNTEEKTDIIEPMGISLNSSKNNNEKDSAPIIEPIKREQIVQDIEKDNKIAVSENSKKLDKNLVNGIEDPHIYLQEKILARGKGESRSSDVETLSNINFRDNINITNITYNEAPITIQSENIPSINQQTDFPQESRDYWPKTYNEQRKMSDLHQRDRYYKNILQSNNDETSSPADRSLLHIPIKSEYSEMFDENAKHIIEAIQKRKNIPPKIPQINPDEEYEHFTFLGAKPKMNKDNTEENKALPVNFTTKNNENLEPSTDSEQNLMGSDMNVKNVAFLENEKKKINNENEVLFPEPISPKDNSSSS